MKKSEVWLKCLEAAKATILSKNTQALAKEADQLVVEFESRFGDIYEPENKKPEDFIPAEKDFG
jgi:hypothetical protein